MHTTETIIISAYFIYFNRKFNKKENGFYSHPLLIFVDQQPCSLIHSKFSPGNKHIPPLEPIRAGRIKAAMHH